MDGIIILSADIEGIYRLKLVLKLAQEHGLEIKKKKCQLLQKRVEFLGFVVEDRKIQPGDAKVIVIKKFPEPKTQKQVQSYLGLTGYFRKFIAGYVNMKNLGLTISKRRLLKY
ncbi:uncharacterized protein [Diabrotica undecimpunctata]|uniref:uncharacterized protein n=1 Tax=Diabrotica undecimpunctata TaxID=50387 RepID=UPI003B64228D